MLTGRPAAVLESLLTESVGSAGYFYPLACVREQVEALWATARSHGDERRKRRRPRLFWPNVVD